MSEEKLGAYVVQREQGKSYPVGDSQIWIKLTPQETGERYELAISTVPPGFGPPPHIHEKMDQAFYILEGPVTFTLGKQTLEAQTGTLVLVPKGVAHAFSNPGTKTGRMLQIQSGGALEPMFEELSKAFPVGVPVDRRRLGEIMARHDHLAVVGA